MFVTFACRVLLSSGLIATTLAASSTGCGKALPSENTPGKSHDTPFKTSDGQNRSYIIHIPSNYDINKPVPLIFSFHGHGKTAAGQEQLSQFSNEASDYNPNGIAVYPQGTENSEGTVSLIQIDRVYNHCLLTSYRLNGKATQMLYL